MALTNEDKRNILEARKRQFEAEAYAQSIEEAIAEALGDEAAAETARSAQAKFETAVATLDGWLDDLPLPT
jgi:uncharacterized membrane protein